MKLTDCAFTTIVLLISGWSSDPLDPGGGITTADTPSNVRLLSAAPEAAHIANLSNDTGRKGAPGDYLPCVGVPVVVTVNSREKSIEVNHSSMIAIGSLVSAR